MVATDALESHIATSEAEVAQMKEGVVGKRDLLRIWRKALATFNPKRAASKKRAVGNPRKAVASGASVTVSLASRTSQLPVSRWHEQIGDRTLADGILDPLVHNAHRIEMWPDSMRKDVGSPGLALTVCSKT